MHSEMNVDSNAILIIQAMEICLSKLEEPRDIYKFLDMIVYGEVHDVMNYINKQGDVS